jgi:hypothetical protein
MPGSPPIPRTTEDLVRGIIDTQAGKDLTPFIAIANQLTTDVCGASGYTDGFVGSKMELIERWLSAHFYTVFDNQLTHAKAGTVTVGYQTKIDLGLKTSMYGQQALILDTDLNLAALENLAQTKRRVRLRMIWMGKRRWPGDMNDWDIATIQE